MSPASIVALLVEPMLHRSEALLVFQTDLKGWFSMFPDIFKHIKIKMKSIYKLN